MKIMRFTFYIVDVFFFLHEAGFGYFCEIKFDFDLS